MSRFDDAVIELCAAAPSPPTVAGLRARVRRRRLLRVVAVLGVVTVVAAVSISAAASLSKRSGPSVDVTPTTASAAGAWCVPITREAVIARVRHLTGEVDPGDRFAAKLVTAASVNAADVRRGVTASSPALVGDDPVWAVLVTGKVHPSFAAAVSFAWALYFFDARSGDVWSTRAGTERNQLSGWTELVDHGDDCTGSRPPLTPTTFARTAAGGAMFVGGLVSASRVPHATSVEWVRADGDVIVVATTIVDRAQASELWEAIARHVDCDDSFLLVKGLRVVLRDGRGITAARPGVQIC